MRFWTFVPVNAQPAQIVQLRTLTVFDMALAVGILNPNDKSPAVMARVKVVKERRPRISDM